MTKKETIIQLRMPSISKQNTHKENVELMKEAGSKVILATIEESISLNSKEFEELTNNFMDYEICKKYMPNIEDLGKKNDLLETIEIVEEITNFRIYIISGGYDVARYVCYAK